jgi:hypothetical protein
MTRKDYVLIADAIRDALATDIEFGIAIPEREASGIHRAALRLSDRLEQDNPRFDREVFLKACSLKA